MKIINQARQTGKTDELIQMAALRGGYIVSRDRQHAECVAHRAQQLKLNIRFPITFREFLDGQFYQGRDWGIKEFYLDDVDILIQNLARGVEVVAITVSGHE